MRRGGCELATESKGTRSPVEVRQALAGMSDIDYVRLSKAAKYFAPGTSFAADDLIQEAIRRLLDGSRNWPTDVQLTTFLSNVMKSIVWADRRQSKSRPLIVPIESTGPFGQRNNVDASVQHSSAEEVVLIEGESDERINEVLRLFEDDEDASMVLMGLSDEMSAQEIRDELGLDSTSYNTIRRRIRRKANKAIEEGRLNGK